MIHARKPGTRIGARTIRARLERSATGFVLSALLLVAFTGAPLWATVQPGDTAPLFTLKDRNDGEVSLEDFRGKVVLLNLVGYACQPCIEDAASVEAIWQDFQGQEFQALALDFWNGTVSDVQFFVDQTGVSFPVLRDAAFLSLQSQYGLGFDNFVVIDADGIVRYTSENEAFDPFNDQAIRQTIQQFLPTAVQQVNWTTIKGRFR